MHIDYERSGGYANITTTYNGNTDELSKEVANKLTNLVEGSRFFTPTFEFFTRACMGTNPKRQIVTLNILDYSGLWFFVPLYPVQRTYFITKL